MGHKTQNLLKRRSGYSKLHLLAFVLVFGLVGGIILLSSFAAPTPTTISGRLQTIVGDNLENHTNVHVYWLTTSDGKKLKIKSDNLDTSQYTGGSVTVTGTLSTNQAGTSEIQATKIESLSTSSSSEVTAASAEATSASTGARKTAVIMFRYPSDPATSPISKDQLRSDFFGGTKLNAFLKEESYGKVSLVGVENPAGDVFGYYTLGGSPPTNCFDTYPDALDALGDALDGIARADGHDMSAYQNTVYVTPKVLCGDEYPGTEGWGPVGGRRAYVRLNNRTGLAGTTATWTTTAHELTHNFGTSHADGLTCKNSAGQLVRVSNSCQVGESDDPYDVMGANNLAHSNSYFKYALGWLSTANIKTVTTSGTYTLTPTETAGNGVKSLRILRKQTSSLGPQYYNLEYRQPIGFDKSISYASAFKGALIHLDNVANPGGFVSGLINMNPTGSGNEAMADNTVFTDADYNIQIKQLSHNTAGVKLQIVVGAAGGDITPPSTPPNFTATTTSTSASFSWNASTDNIGVAGYRLVRNAKVVYNGTARSFTNTGLAPSTAYVYKLYAYDKAGNDSDPASKSINTKPGASVDNIPPSAPTNVVTVASSTECRLTWNPSTDNADVDQYRIFRNGNTVGYSPTTDYTDAGLNPGQSYTYSVYAVDTSGNLNVYNVSQTAVCATTLGAGDITPPSAPSNVKAVAVSTSQINLSWSPSTDNVGVASYRVFRNGNTVGTVASPTTSFSDTSLNAGTTYTYSIYAVDTSGNLNVYNASTQVATGTTFPAADTTPPSAPTNVKATGISTSQINLSWSPSTDNVGVAYYRVFRNGNTVATVTSPTTSYFDVGLNAGTTYTYSIYAVDTSGNLNVYNASTQVATGTTQPAADTTPPSAPSNVSATGISTSQISINWTASSDNVGISYYQIYRNGNSVGTTSSINFTDSGLNAGTTYTYSIYAVDTSGNKNIYNASTQVATGTTFPAADTTPPSAPSNVSATGISSSQISINWTASTDNVAVSYYRIFRNGNTVATTPNINYVDVGLNAGTTYTYSIYAVDTSGNQNVYNAATQVGTGTTFPAADTIPPSAPSNVKATGISTSQISLTWNPSTDNIAVYYYQIYRNGNNIASTGNTSYTDVGLNAGTTYTYSIYAVDTSNNRNIYNAATQVATGSTFPAADTTPPSAPSGVSAIGVSTSQINLSWNASTDNVAVSYYQVYRNGNMVGTTGATSFSDTGLNSGTTYTYSIYAVDSSGNKNVYNASTQVATGTTQPAADTTPPSAPSNVSATGISTSQISLSWSPSSDNVGISYYQIYRNGNSVGTTGSTSYTDGGLNAGTTYTYSIYAIDTSGNRNVYNASTQVATGTTQPAADTTPPSAPSNVSATGISTSQISINWTASSDNVGVAYYKIFRNGNNVGTTSSTSFTDGGLNAGQTYTYSIYAVDNSGNQNVYNAATQVATGTTLATPPPPPPPPPPPSGSNVTICLFDDGSFLYPPPSSCRNVGGQFTTGCLYPDGSIRPGGC